MWYENCIVGRDGSMKCHPSFRRSPPEDGCPLLLGVRTKKKRRLTLQPKWVAAGTKGIVADVIRL